MWKKIVSAARAFWDFIKYRPNPNETFDEWAAKQW